jgi:poly(A)-specific ribonuclease
VRQPRDTDCDADTPSGARQAAVAVQVGFRAVIDAIARRQVPVVGHNALLDLAHLHSHFLGPMPDNANAFKRAIHDVFP